MKVGLVGCGNIGADLCIAMHKETLPAEIVALHDIDEERAHLLQRTFHLEEAAICGLDEMAERVDFIVECAVAGAVQGVIETAIKYRRDCLVMSVSGLLAHPELLDLARENHVQIRIPSGALCGLDGIRSAMEAGLHSVTLTTRKPPKAFSGAPYVVKHNIDLDNLTEPKTLFEGTAAEAVKMFPANVNVAAALSLMGIGPLETKVRIIADPRATENMHEVMAEGAFGRLQTFTTNMPSPRNAKSSYLASLSACAELRAAAMAFVYYCQDCTKSRTS
jgi:aspartate dehydrogenase